MSNIKLSIIIPVYKVEKFIEKCLNSIFDQDVELDYYEVIVVNDGSPDKSMDIVYMFAENYENLHIINQENHGLSAARNNGLKIARGDYVWFVDSDDWIIDDALAKQFSLMKLCGSDMISFDKINYFEEKGEFETICRDRKNKNRYVLGKEYFRKLQFHCPAQFFLFKKCFLIENHLFFENGILHEDREFTPRAIYLAKNIFVSSEIFYVYRRRDGGITQQANIKRCIDLLDNINRLNDFVAKNEFQWIYKESAIKFNCSSIKYSMILSHYLTKNERNIVVAKVRKKNNILIGILFFVRTSSLSKIGAFVLLLSPLLYSSLYCKLHFLVRFKREYDGVKPL